MDRFSPLLLFSTYLNYDSKQSLTEYLLKEELVIAFDDDVVIQDYAHGLYMIAFELTEKGKRNCGRILKLFFRFVELLSADHQRLSVYNRLSQCAKYSFLFNVRSMFKAAGHAETDLFTKARKLAKRLQNYPFEQSLSIDSLFVDYDKELFDEFMARLVPKNAVYLLEESESESQDNAPA